MSSSVRAADNLQELIKLERWRQTKVEAEISSYQCRILRLGELLHRDTSTISSLTPSQVVISLLHIFASVFFSNKIINRWNLLDQRMVDAPGGINAFKSTLQQIRDNRMGIFMD